MKTDNSVLDNAQTKPVENGLCAERGPCRSLAAGRGEGGCSRSNVHFGGLATGGTGRRFVLLRAITVCFLNFCGLLGKKFHFSTQRPFSTLALFAFLG